MAQLRVSRLRVSADPQVLKNPRIGWKAPEDRLKLLAVKLRAVPWIRKVVSVFTQLYLPRRYWATLHTHDVWPQVLQKAAHRAAYTVIWGTSIKNRLHTKQHTHTMFGPIIENGCTPWQLYSFSVKCLHDRRPKSPVTLFLSAFNHWDILVGSVRMCSLLNVQYFPITTPTWYLSGPPLSHLPILNNPLLLTISSWWMGDPFLPSPDLGTWVTSPSPLPHPPPPSHSGTWVTSFLSPAHLGTWVTFFWSPPNLGTWVTPFLSPSHLGTWVTPFLSRPHFGTSVTPPPPPPIPTPHCLATNQTWWRNSITWQSAHNVRCGCVEEIIHCCW